MQTLTVALGARSYPIQVGHRTLANAGDLPALAEERDVLVVSNETVAPLYLDGLRAALGTRRVVEHLLPDGEQHKTLAHVAAIVDSGLAAGLGRDAVFVALGGGVVGDMTGFAAAVFMRGVDCVQIPTTLLAQVDSSVGGKTGVNHPSGKNLIGAFHQPRAVLIDTATLDTLPQREFSAGMAEVIKHGLIEDAGYFDWLKTHMPGLVARDPALLAQAILRSCEIKAAVVAADEREQGRRAILNFGHTFGHAIEACTDYRRWLHGEAVAIGMRMAAEMSDLSPADQQQLADVLDAAGLPAAPGPLDADAMRRAMTHDKKVVARRITLILLDRIGAARVRTDYDPARLDAVLDAWCR